MRLGALHYPASTVCIPAEFNPLRGPWLYLVVVSYLRKPWIMAMPSDSSSTYHATISMMLSAVLLLLSPRVSRCSTPRVDAELTANALALLKSYL
jgi:hypothetical protein